MKVRVVPGVESMAGSVRAVEQGVRRRQRDKLAVSNSALQAISHSEWSSTVKDFTELEWFTYVQ